MAFSISSIDAKSDVPLNLLLPGSEGRLTVNTSTWQTLWRASGGPTANAFVAWPLEPSRPTDHVSLSVECRIGPKYDGKDVTLQGGPNDLNVVQCSFKANSAAPHILNTFFRLSPPPFPVSYRGPWRWTLSEGITVVETLATTTPIEVYSIITPAVSLWRTHGVSVNCLRLYLPVWGWDKVTWNISHFYRYVLNTIHSGPLQYDNVRGEARYTSYLGGSFKLDQYCREVENRSNEKINCYDTAGIVQIILSLCPRYNAVRWNYMTPYGYINTTKLVGWTDINCNNPLWGNSSSWNDQPLVPQDYEPGKKRRSAFRNHAFIVGPSGHILDACAGPHVGTETLSMYLASAIDYTTNYYSNFPGNGPGNPGNISKTQIGIMSLSFTLLFKDSPVSTIQGAHSEAINVTEPTSTRDHASITVDELIEHARVGHTDHTHLTCVDPSELKSLLGQISGMELTHESVAPRAGGSEVNWTFGTPHRRVEATIVGANSCEAALGEMKEALHSFSAPLNTILTHKLRLGHFSLQGIVGRGLFLFVRGNVFVKLSGLSNSTELSKIAIEVDRFLAGRRAGVESVLGSRISHREISPRRVRVGETFEVVVDAVDIGWMTGFTDLNKVQLLEMDPVRGAFVFCAGSKGQVDIRLVFAHKSTLQTETAMMRVEVIEDKTEEVDNFDSVEKIATCDCIPFSSQASQCVESLADCGLGGAWMTVCLLSCFTKWCKARLSLGVKNVEQKELKN